MSVRDKAEIGATVTDEETKLVVLTIIARVPKDANFGSIHAVDASGLWIDDILKDEKIEIDGKEMTVRW